MSKIVESLEEFTERQGCEHVQSRVASRWMSGSDSAELDEVDFPDRDTFNVRMLFANGAVAVLPGGIKDFVQFSEPPTDPLAMAEVKGEFALSKAAKLAREYNGLRRSVAEQAEFHRHGAGPHPDDRWPGWREHLAQLTADIDQLKAEAQALREQVDQLRAEQGHGPSRAEQFREYQDKRAAERRAGAEAMGQLSNFPPIH